MRGVSESTADGSADADPIVRGRGEVARVDAAPAASGRVSTRCSARRFESGVDLSGGEWQKIALARAYMRDAQVLILDEPTAALDARAEYEVFQRFSELTRADGGADLPPVLDGAHGRPHRRAARRRGVEEGTHEELVAAAGCYAELFGCRRRGTDSA